MTIMEGLKRSSHMYEKESKKKGCEYESHVTRAHDQPNIFDVGSTKKNTKAYRDRESKEMSKQSNKYPNTY
jgi:hypothetical protein